MVTPVYTLNLQGLLCAAVILQMGNNSHICSLELLIKPRLKNSAPSEENICEIYLALLKSQTHPLHSWKKLVQIEGNCNRMKQCIFKPHVLGEKHWINTDSEYLFSPILYCEGRKKTCPGKQYSIFFCGWVMLSQWTTDVNKNLRTKPWDGD